MNKTILLYIIIIVLLFSGCRFTSDTVTLESLLSEMTNRYSLSYFPDKPYKHKQFSSYNRASVSPDSAGWFANADMSHFIRVEDNEGRREFVMFDADGPGAVVRWWMTFYKAQNGVIRVYIDSNAEPVIQGTPVELLRGSQVSNPPLAASVQEGAPLGEEGRDYDHNFYVPIPFSEHCKITYECDSLRLLYDYEGIKVPEGYYWPDVFYNIGYRAYKKKTRVESVTSEILASARPLFEQTGRKLLDDLIISGSEEKIEKFLTQGDSLSVRISQKNSAVTKLALKIEAENLNQSLRSTVLKISFDGMTTVWIPAGEFFGTGYSLYPHKTWMNKSDSSGLLESYWVMPFKEKAVITLINYGTDSLHMDIITGISDYRWKKNSMYFGSSWHEYNRIASRSSDGSPYDLNFINIRGEGVYTGDQVTLYNDTWHWWGEGDEKIFVDGESFPSSFGTGSEDYFGYSFARREPFSHPFISQPVGIGNMSWGVTVDMRHRSLDVIPFSESISSNIELWHWADIRMNYALTSYYYVKPPYEINVKSDIESVKRRVVVTRDDFIPDKK
ncbi:MAG TPA: glycoside hydrolase family 172 protein [Bacteroidales bacterium]|nr:glycoside hydrolase family 172 protein [Bacteroidales bacterium]